MDYWVDSREAWPASIPPLQLCSETMLTTCYDMMHQSENSLSLRELQTSSDCVMTELIALCIECRFARFDAELEEILFHA